MKASLGGRSILRTALILVIGLPMAIVPLWQLRADAPPAQWEAELAVALAGAALCVAALVFLILDLDVMSPRRGEGGARVAAEPRPDPLLDLALDALTAGDASRRKALQEEALGGATPGQWEAALMRARGLLDEAGELCEKSRDGSLSSSTIPALLRERHPGFSEASCRKVYDRAMLASR